MLHDGGDPPRLDVRPLTSGEPELSPEWRHGEAAEGFVDVDHAARKRNRVANDSLRGRFRAHLATGIAERSLLKLDPLPNDPFEPGVEVLFAMQPSQKCGSPREICGQSNGLAATLYVDRRFPRKVVMHFSDDAFVDDVLP
ncbi:MAG: hypothetical protein QOE68_2472 [Thermoanaerobaculia bacterium]|jgi:hypothetical protein|nr:hypothetical protein [Thermoanaerobaculia bacterium]